MRLTREGELVDFSDDVQTIVVDPRSYEVAISIDKDDGE